MIKNKISVLIFVGLYVPGYKGGGPIRTISNLVERLGEDFNFKIITSDRDLGDKTPYDSVKINSWNKVGNADVYYFDTSSKNTSEIKSTILNTSSEIYYFNSFFNKNFTIKPLFIIKFIIRDKKPIIIAPRGEFSIAALNNKRALKKTYISVFKKLKFFNEIIWHASTPAEAIDISNALGVDATKIHIALNIPSAEIIDTQSNLALIKNQNSYVNKNNKPPLRICFLSRIALMKNLDFALKVLTDVKIEAIFNIYGPIESNEYWDSCKKIIRDIPSNIQVNYLGPVSNSEVKEKIASHDVFFVPSLGENFGHVFLESLSSGVPILVSDKTPWRNLAEKNIGWDFSLEDKNSFIETIEKLYHLSIEEKIQIKFCCLNFAKSLRENNKEIQNNINLFKNSLVKKENSHAPQKNMD